MNSHEQSLLKKKILDSKSKAKCYYSTIVPNAISFFLTLNFSFKVNNIERPQINKRPSLCEHLDSKGTRNIMAARLKNARMILSIGARSLAFQLLCQMAYVHFIAI